MHSLPKIVAKSKRRVGQGHGSGRVKTSGRGTKGQKARRNISLTFEGGALPLIKRLPFRRGKSKNNSFKSKPIIVNLKALNLLPTGSVVDVALLAKYKIVEESEAKQFGVKILGDGELKSAFTVKLPTSKSAKEKIEKAKGSVQGA